MSVTDAALAEARACRICRDVPLGKPLPHEPRPILVISGAARVLIASQAPGIRAHRSGVPFLDRSGERLRDWMGVSENEFYGPGNVAILPMGFCFPGNDAKGGDLPPRRECAPAWRGRLLATMPQVDLLLAVGSHAQRWHLGGDARTTLNDTVADWRRIVGRARSPLTFPLPHPSWRNTAWIKANSWFETELLPTLRAAVRERLPGRDVFS